MRSVPPPKPKAATAQGKETRPLSLTEEELEEAKRLFLGREPPHVMLRDSHEAQPVVMADSTKVPGSNRDTVKWAVESMLRLQRNQLIRGVLESGRSVFYMSTGNSMWPLVQSNDACWFHPVQAVTATSGDRPFQKAESPLEVGDIVFCQVQPSNYYYAHIILEEAEGPKYLIGNILQRSNGWCRRENIFGILVDVQVWWDDRYWSRPHPKGNYRQCAELVRQERRHAQAEYLCRPTWAESSAGTARREKLAADIKTATASWNSSHLV